MIKVTFEQLKQHFSKEEALAVLKGARELYQSKLTREHLSPGSQASRLKHAHEYSKYLCQIMALEFQVKRSF